MGKLWSAGFVALGVLALTLLAVAAPTPPARPPEPGIESVVHDAQRPLKAGDRIRVTARASSGGAGRFHIVGVASDMGMRRSQGPGYGGGGPGATGMYVGNYVIQSGEVVRDAAILATLAVGGREITEVGRQPVTIDTRPPRITVRIPAPESRLANVRPNILVALVEEITSINPSSVGLAVNGRNVTSRASISGGWVSYIPEAPLPVGRTRVVITAADRVGNVLKEEWAFLVVPPDGLIASVTANPAIPLRPGEVFSVVVTGAPGGLASFTIGNPGSSTPMREARPGQYVGTGTAGTGTLMVDESISATLVKGNVRHTMRATTGLTVLARSPAQPTIDVPRPGTALGSRLVMRGRGPVRYIIEARISYSGRSGSGQRQGVLGEIATVVGNTGAWSMIVDPLIAPDGSRVIIAVTAIDPTGQRSAPTSLELTVD